jgi:signal transduction histidine kinase
MTPDNSSVDPPPSARIGPPTALDGADDPRNDLEALRELHRRKDEFLAVLAHELRNPLAPLRNGVQLVRAIGTPDSKVSSLLTMMDRQLGILSRLVDDLLDVSRVGSGKLQVDLAPVDIAELVRACCDTVSSQFQRKRHSIRLTACNQRCVVDGDRDRLQQVFTNLLSNAVKYSDSVTMIDVRIEAEEDWVRVEVRDQGVGLDAEEVASIFNMYSQVRLHRARAEGGLGIGLALVRRLVELHGGKVWATSDGPGHGSAFYVCLPRLQTDGAA